MIERKDNTWLQLDVCPSWRFPHSFQPLTLWLHTPELSMEKKSFSLWPTIWWSKTRITGRPDAALRLSYVATHILRLISPFWKGSALYLQRRRIISKIILLHTKKNSRKGESTKKSRLRTVNPASSLLSKVHWGYHNDQSIELLR